jgi:hypothetical protein
MRGQAMTKICAKALAQGEPMSSYRALEFFAREGDWHTKSYAHLVRSLDAWELDPTYEHGLRENLPHANIRIGNSFSFAQESQYRNYFHWLVLDNPQSIYGEYCEHFEALELVHDLVAESGVLIFNVNKKPFDYERHAAWQARREQYYGCDANILTTPFLLSFYQNKLEASGLSLRYIYEEPRNPEYLSYIVAGIANKTIRR